MWINDEYICYNTLKIDGLTFIYNYSAIGPYFLLSITPEAREMTLNDPARFQEAMKKAIDSELEMQVAHHIDICGGGDFATLAKKVAMLIWADPNEYNYIINGCIDLISSQTAPLEYKAVAREILNLHSSKQAKQKLTRIRRSEFNGKKKALLLSLVDKQGYICNHPNCVETEDLTIDHLIPLSKGGTDNIDNLQLLCRSHNSQKGDRI